MRGDDVGRFYTQGKAKCQHCGLYEDANRITGHEANCDLNPANQSGEGK